MAASEDMAEHAAMPEYVAGLFPADDLTEHAAMLQDVANFCFILVVATHFPA